MPDAINVLLTKGVGHDIGLCDPSGSVCCVCSPPHAPRRESSALMFQVCTGLPNLEHKILSVCKLAKRIGPTVLVGVGNQSTNTIFVKVVWRIMESIRNEGIQEERKEKGKGEGPEGRGSKNKRETDRAGQFELLKGKLASVSATQQPRACATRTTSGVSHFFERERARHGTLPLHR